jgi:UDP-GlcNAc:undecaprenyl-phosphate GlcNAc-1-phosphate transferase
MTRLFLYVLGGLLSSLVLVPLCRAVALQYGCVAPPRPDRWHRKPTAMLGGVAVGVTVLAGGLTLPLPSIALLMAAGGLILVVGVADDLIILTPAMKLAAEVAAASILLFFGLRLEWTGSPLLDALLTMIWIVGVTNAFNMLDNMDGLCAGTAVIGIVGLLVATLELDGVTPQALYIALLLGAVCGFLVYNVHPASIFLGDSGSLFIGLNLAALTLAVSPNRAGKASLLSLVAVPVMLLMIPIFDTALVTISRLLSRRSPARGGRDHSSHRLVAIGLSERRAVSVLWVLALCSGAIAVAVRQADAAVAIFIAGGFVAAMIVLAVFLAKVRVYEADETDWRISGDWTPLGLARRKSNAS